MRLTKYSCKNYARLQDFEITVRDNLFIVGANDVGKSSLLCTMDWLLGFSHSRLYATVQQSDFRDLSESLILEATLDSLSDIELAAFPDEVTVDPVGGAITLALRMVAEFDDLGETISIQRFAPDSGRIRNLSPSQLEMLGWSLLGATSKARDIRGTRQAGMGELLESVDLGADKIEFNSLNQQFAQLLQSANSLESVRKEISGVLAGALPERIDASELKFVPGSFAEDEPLNDVRLHVEKHGEFKDIAEQSDGIRSLYAIALHDLKQGDTNIIAIDEPEMHLHPSSQRSLARLLLAGSTQKIVVTHSQDIISMVPPQDVVVVKPGGTVVQPRADFLDGETNLVARWWSRNKLEPLTARSLIAVEGISDAILIDAIARALSINLDAVGCVVFELDGAGDVRTLAKLFGENGFDVALNILIDEDATKNTAKFLGLPENELDAHGVWVSSQDLEDEYVNAIGADTIWAAFTESHLFGENDLNNCSIEDGQSAPSNSALAEFIRKKSKRKTNAAIVVAELLTADSASKVSSIASLLDSLKLS